MDDVNIQAHRGHRENKKQSKIIVITAKAGIQLKTSGFRLKAGMTALTILPNMFILLVNDQ
jgi:hypothetical protein